MPPLPLCRQFYVSECNTFIILITTIRMERHFFKLKFVKISIGDSRDPFYKLRSAIYVIKEIREISGMSLFNRWFHTDVDLLGETSSTSFVSSPHSTSFNAQVWSNFCFPFQSSWSLKASQFIVIHFLLILITWWRDVQYDSTPAIQTPCVTMWIQYIHSITGWCVNMFYFLCILIPTASPIRCRPSIPSNPFGC